MRACTPMSALTHACALPLGTAAAYTVGVCSTLVSGRREDAMMLPVLEAVPGGSVQEGVKPGVAWPLRTTLCGSLRLADTSPRVHAGPAPPTALPSHRLPPEEALASPPAPHPHHPL